MVADGSALVFISNLKIDLKQYISLIVVLLLFSCNELKDVPPFNPGFSYYPVQQGEYRVYAVEEIRFSLSGNDTSRYFLREYITDSILTDNQTTYLLTRDKRADQSQQWETDSIWTFARTENFLRITENNVPFMKLTFPIRTTAEWNGNSLNTRQELIYYYEELEQPLIDSIAAADHIRVVIEDIESIVTGDDLRSEVYVKGVGLVEKDYFTQVLCTTTAQCDSDELGSPISGRSLKQTLIAIE